MLFSKKVKKILKEHSGEKAIMEVENLLTPIFLSAPEKLSEEEKNIVFIGLLESQVNNGGFDHFFFGFSGAFVPETVNALRAVGSTKFLTLLESAIAQFPSSYVPKDLAKRHEILQTIENDAEPIWNDLDSKFYKYEEDIYALMLPYISANIKKFR